MKKIAVVLFLMLFPAAFTFCQDIQFNYEVKYTRDASGVKADITVTVQSGSPEFVYYITTNHPVNSKVLFKSDRTKKRSYTFEGVKPGTYFIKIEDGSGEQRGQSVIISESMNL
jgi:hypothetical protein